jgi:hypothetical protein
VNSHRGHGWNWGIKRDLIPANRPNEGFLRSGLWLIVRCQVLLVLFLGAIQISRENDPDFLLGLGVPDFPGRRIVSKISFAIAFGAGAWNLLEVGATMVSVYVCMLCRIARSLPLPAVLRPEPFDARSWPPLLRSPLQSDSLADFWTYRWHR